MKGHKQINLVMCIFILISHMIVALYLNLSK